MNYELITNNKDLKKLCKSIKKKDVLSIDIEFMRYKTFYPILCLIQVNVHNKDYVIDTMADGLKMKPFFKVLRNPKVIKVLHSSFQDIGVIFHEFKKTPKSIWDTQLMANFLGYDFNISYAKLVLDLVGVELSKEQQRSDWSKRPLSDEQLEYAVNDVKYLPKIYEILRSKLEEEGKLKFFLKESKKVLKRKDYNVDKQDLTKKFALRNKKQIYVGNVKRLVSWRDKVAKRRNIPRTFVLKDNVLSEIAKSNPKNHGQLTNIFKSNNVKYFKFNKEVLKMVNKKRRLRFVPRVWKVFKFKSKFNARFSERQKSIYEEAKNLLLINSQDHGIRPELIINQNDLKQIILGNSKVKKILKGWRYKIFGKDLKKLL